MKFHCKESSLKLPFSERSFSTSLMKMCKLISQRIVNEDSKLSFLICNHHAASLTFLKNMSWFGRLFCRSFSKMFRGLQLNVLLVNHLLKEKVVTSFCKYCSFGWEALFYISFSYRFWSIHSSWLQHIGNEGELGVSCFICLGDTDNINCLMKYHYSLWFWCRYVNEIDLYSSAQ